MGKRTWIKVELIPRTIVDWTTWYDWGWVRKQPVYSGRHWRIFCKTCGHDDFRDNYDDAQWRAEEMFRDHIPGSPDGSLSCKDW